MNKIKAVSDISRDIAQVFFASVFIGPLVSGTASLPSLVIGLALSIVAWYFSLALIKN